MIDPDDYIFIGKLGKITGIDGSLTIVPLTSFPERFRDMKEFFLTKQNNPPITLKVGTVSYNKKKISVKFDSIDSIEKANKLSGYRITIQKKERVELPEDHYYIDDLTSCYVFSEDGTDLGPLVKVMEMSSNDIYVVDHKGKELLIPAISQFVKEIDIERKKITVSLINGMLPDED